MESIETLIPDNEGNHLVVALSFYDDNDKADTFQIPEEFAELDIADISIAKMGLDKPLSLRAFFSMCHWLIEQLTIFPNAVFSFICSTDPLDTNHPSISPEEYRWHLFEYLYARNISRLQGMGIESKEIIVGPVGYQTFARVFFRTKHAPIIHFVISHLESKYIN
ncbi:MAG: hypothetical protein NC117_10345 [Pseudoflavonifractor sp.]|nr:hypothetical protein [Pseudoflavonifractor sp.]